MFRGYERRLLKPMRTRRADLGGEASCRSWWYQVRWWQVLWCPIQASDFRLFPKVSEQRVEDAAVQQRFGWMTARIESVKLSSRDDIAAIELKLQSSYLDQENTFCMRLSIHRVLELSCDEDRVAPR